MAVDSSISALQRIVERLAPERVTAVVAPVAKSIDGVREVERELIYSWAHARQCEFVAGRMCARRGLAALDVPAGDLLPDAEGVPVWPEGVVASISHSGGVAMAVVALSADCRFLGLDLEKTDRLSAAAIQRVVHPLEAGFAGGDQVKASILFSLKEAFYKAQFPLWRTTGNFHDLALSVDLGAGTARVRQMDSRFAPELERAHFAFNLVGDFVLSLCWSR